jgi:hypothetical protein
MKFQSAAGGTRFAGISLVTARIDKVVIVIEWELGRQLPVTFSQLEIELAALS